MAKRGILEAWSRPFTVPPGTSSPRCATRWIASSRGLSTATGIGRAPSAPAAPDTVDDIKVEAKFDKGVLKVTVAKRPEAVKTERKIEIKKA